MSDCEKSETSCQTNQTHQTECKTGADSSCCPVEMAVEKWSGSFCQAMSEVQVEILKQKIKKSWGAEMEKVSDAVIEAMGAEWFAMLSKAKAHVDLRERTSRKYSSQDGAELL